jgi:hypothetical protein
MKTSPFFPRVAMCSAWVVIPMIAAALAPALPAADPPAPAAQAAADDDTGDLIRKAEIMNSPRWRRAIFELGEWLSSQKIYTPQQVRGIKADFNKRVAAMSSYELDYLLDDLDAKFKILETPEARDARNWVGQYLSVMSDRKRADVMRDMPDVVNMSAAQLQQEIVRVENRRTQLERQQSAFDQSRQQLVERAQASRQATAAASNAAAARAQSGTSFSPYRSQGGGKPPFSDVKGSGMSVGVGPFGAYVNFSVGNF